MVKWKSRPVLRAGTGLPRIPSGVVVPQAVRRAVVQEPSILVVRAPRGAGKTSTVSSVIRDQMAHGRRVRWVTLPNAPLSRDQFWEVNYGSLTGEGLAPEMNPLVEVASFLSGLDRPITLVVDNLMHVSDHRVDDDLVELASEFELFHVIVMTRGERHVEALTDGFSDGQVLRMHDLALDPLEIQSMAQQTGCRLSEGEAELMVDSLTGWPALVRAVLSSSSRSEAGLLIPDWAAAERYIRVALSDAEMWSIAPDLKMLSTPRDFSIDEGGALVGRDRAAALVPLMLDLGFLRQRTAQGRTRFYFLERLRDAVQGIYRADDRAGYVHAHRLTATFCLAAGRAREGLDHAVEGEDWDAVSSLIERYWLEMVHEHPGQVRHVVDALPDQTIADSARLTLMRDFLLDLDRWERWDAAFRDGRLSPDLSDETYLEPLSLGQRLTIQSAMVERESWHGGDRRREAAIESWSPQIKEAVPQLLLQWSVSKLLNGEVVSAAGAFREAYRWARGQSDAVAMAEAANGLALCLALLGHMRAARGWVEVGSRSGGECGPVMAVVAALVGSILGLDSARDLGGKPVPVTEDFFGIPGLEQIDLGVRGILALHHEPSRAPLLAEIESELSGAFARGSRVSFAHAGLLCTAVDLCIATGQTDKARQLLTSAPVGESWVRVSLARMALYDGSNHRVLKLSADYGDIATTSIGHALHLSTTRACAAWRLGMIDEARDALLQSIGLAEQSGTRRAFLLVPRSDLLAMAEQFGGSFSNTFIKDLGAAPEVFGEPLEPVTLTNREFEVLRAVSTGAPLSQAAKALFVSENTVKTQVRNIYRKLGVNSRDAAIERARGLGLLGSGAQPERPPAQPGGDATVTFL